MTGGPDRTIVRFDGAVLGYRRRPVLEPLSFGLDAGEFLGIVGPNGSGKSTILRALLGLIRPLSGRMERRNGLVLGYVPQRDRIDTILPVTAFEVALMGRAARRSPMALMRPADRARAHESLELLGVADLAPRLFRDLSGGQQQRVLLARALTADPDVLVLDEPTTGMDLASETAIVELLSRLHRQRGLSVVLVTHLLPIVLNSAETILLLDRGRSLYGPIDDVLDEDLLRGLYGIPVHLATVAGRRTLVAGPC